MVELKVNNHSDREKIIMGLVNSGFTVKVVEKPDPNRNWRNEYFVQILDGDIKVFGNLQ